MNPIIYDVAVSSDGFISGRGEDVSRFAHDGPVVQDYASRLATYKTALMGRRTYEFGYAFGLKPGQNPYPNMRTIVFSDTLELPDDAEVSVRSYPTPAEIRQLTHCSDGPIYLCGGGDFAGWMLDSGLIDRLILKRAPCILGAGTKLFGSVSHSLTLSRTNTTTYENGYLLEEFELR